MGRRKVSHAIFVNLDQYFVGDWQSICKFTENYSREHVTFSITTSPVPLKGLAVSLHMKKQSHVSLVSDATKQCANTSISKIIKVYMTDIYLKNLTWSLCMRMATSSLLMVKEVTFLYLTRWCQDCVDNIYCTWF